MKSLFFLTLLLGVNISNAEEPVHFISSIQLQVQEPNLELMNRSQKLVVKTFQNSVELVPHLRGTPLKIETHGPQLVLTMTSQSDLREPIQEILSQMVENLNGKVLAHGRSSFYRASLERPLGGFLEVVMDDVHEKILAISAESVPLRDILNEVRNQAGSMSYLISGDCAEKLVDWSFATLPPEEAKSVDAVMNELAFLFGLKCEKKNGSYIFKGHCPKAKPNAKFRAVRTPPHRLVENPLSSEVLFPATMLTQGMY